jgi:hypothetical protein
MSPFAPGLVDIEGGVVPSRVLYLRDAVCPCELSCAGCIQDLSVILVVLPTSTSFAQRVDSPMCAIGSCAFEICVLGSIVSQR